MFERYTEKARRSIFFSRYEASQFGSPYIETEHLLLGILRESKGLANHFLRTHDALESIRKQAVQHTPVQNKISTSVDLPLSNECKRILVYAGEEADRLSHKYIGTEHLFLGVLREKDCFAAQLLNERSILLETVRVEIQNQVLDDPRPKPPKSGGIPEGFASHKLVYNPASEMLIVEMRSQRGPHQQATRLFMRHKNAESYEQIGDPPPGISFESPVTCEKFPIVVFSSTQWDPRGHGDWVGLHTFDLKTKELSVCITKTSLQILEPHLRSWALELISLSDDARTLYLNIGVERPVPGGTIVDSYLASLDLVEKKLELLSLLKDAHY